MGLYLFLWVQPYSIHIIPNHDNNHYMRGVLGGAIVMRKIINVILIIVAVIGVAFLISMTIPFSLAFPIVLIWMVWKKKFALFHDQIEPKLAERFLKMLKALLPIALISFAMIMVTVLLGVFVFHLSESVVFYIGFFWLYLYAITTSIGLVIVFKGRRKTKIRDTEISTT